MQHEAFEGDPVAKLGELLRDIRFAMLTTIDEAGKLVSRPLSTRAIDFDGDLWFFTDDRSEKIAQIQRNPNVNLGYASKDQETHVSVSGTASMLRDQRRIHELWNAIDNAYFQGKDDPHLVLLKVEVESAEYWDTPGNFFTKTLSFARALATHDPSRLGENATLELKQ